MSELRWPLAARGAAAAIGFDVLLEVGQEALLLRVLRRVLLLVRQPSPVLPGGEERAREVSAVEDCLIGPEQVFAKVVEVDLAHFGQALLVIVNFLGVCQEVIVARDIAGVELEDVVEEPADGIGNARRWAAPDACPLAEARREAAEPPRWVAQRAWACQDVDALVGALQGVAQLILRGVLGRALVEEHVLLIVGGALRDAILEEARHYI
eukprot:8502087-Alexandrium_andersonii.AAC.1